MRLIELIENVNTINKINFDGDLEISGLSIDSRRINNGDAFIAIKGYKKDGHDFASEAVSAGAKVVFVQGILELPSKVTQIILPDCRKALPLLCRNFYGNPTKDIILTGVTGTNGKTTTVFLVDSIFKEHGYNTGYITTVQANIGKDRLIFDRTTPESNELNGFFSECLRNDIEEVCMEVSSHSIDLNRVEQLDFDFLVFTNLSQDHLDYHENMENYFGVKERLFLKEYRKLYGGRAAVLNLDDEYGKKIAGSTDLKKITFGINNQSADISAGDIINSIDGIEMNVFLASNRKSIGIESELCGYFNVYNILASMGAGIAAGIDIEDIRSGVKSMTGVRGRFEKIKLKNGVYSIIDYAHTPDGLENVLRTSKVLLPPDGRLISVFGCGGDRDRTKRKIMGKISAGIADFTIITSDNPRTEDPTDIISMIEEGFREVGVDKYSIEEDRKSAIYNALEMSEKDDIVLIAGKGHEDYQEFKDKKIHFSDQEIVRDWDLK
jgi:UDP-N-acetylmuramoyl-L-alanyl-D-glutamate--2,6-diaminopimelate ligase